MLRPYLLSLTTFGLLYTEGLGATQTPPARCDQWVAAVQADPNNVDAAARLGQCSFRDYEMVAPGGDSAHLMFRSSWSIALRALRHAVEVNRGYSRAYQPLFSILFAETRDGCSSVTGECLHVAPVVRAGDSVLTVPRIVGGGPDPYEGVIRETQTTQRVNLSEARTLAQQWVAVAPLDRRPHEYLGQALLRLGDAAAASAELENAAKLGTPATRRALFWDRMEALVKSDHGDDARRLLDETASDPARDTTQLRAYTVAGLNALLGRNRPPLDTSARDREQRARQSVRMDSLTRTLPPPRRAPSFADLLAAHDTTAARIVLAREDSLLTSVRGPSVMRSSMMGEALLYSAERHLALRDTVGAEARLADIERPLSDRGFRYSVGMAYGPRPWAGRAWLLAGDVAAARGRRDEANRMYRRIVGLWGGGDADLNPVVDQARARLASRLR